MRTYLQPLVAAAARAADPDFTGQIPFEQPKVESYGDIATPIALNLAQKLHRSPRLIAEAIVKNIALEPALCTCEIAGAGFINFRFTPRFFFALLSDLLNDPLSGKKPPQNKTVNIEFVSANPTGLLHLGHARQAALGDSIANLMAWEGWTVVREYYFNNAGRQMRQLAESVYARYRQALGDDDYPLPDDGYAGDYVKTIAEEIFAIQGDALRDATDKMYFQKFAENWCFQRIQISLERMHVTHDVFFNEDTLYADGKIDAVISELRAKGLAYEKEGAVWFKLSEFGLEDRVIVKSTGEPTYRLPDIAYHREKLSRGYDLILDIFGSDHQVTIPDVLAGVRALGGDSDKVKVLIHGWVNLIEGGVAVKMSKRTGKSYTLDLLLDEFGADVVRFFLTMRSASAPLDFDLDLARDQSEKNPVYYLQYAHARIASILRFAEQTGVVQGNAIDADISLLATAEELRLIKIITGFPEAVELAAKYLEPHRLCEYLKLVAMEFHKFYHDHRVVGVEIPLMLARLALCNATLRVLKNGLDLLGVSAPDRMSKGSEEA